MSLASGPRARSEAGALRKAAVFAFASFALSARAEQTGAPKAPDDARRAPDLFQKRLELRGVEERIDASGEQRRKLEGEVATLGADRERLNQALLDAAQKLRAAEERAQEIEKRLETLSGSQEAILKSLAGRRALIGEVLAVLQRMGRRPPPALLARPEDILEAVRASLTLGAVLAPMREEVRALQTDLQELVRLRESVKTQEARLSLEKQELAAQQQRLAPMIEARQEALARTREALDAEAERARILAQQATSLKDLIARLEKESAAARRAAEAARQAEAARIEADAKLSKEQRAQALANPFKDAARLAPAAAFPDLKGRLPLPILGPIVKRFGAPDAAGGTEKGISLAARENAIVTAPCDGWAVFSGPYRSYGRLLIIHAGGGYYVVMAGMSRVNVSMGQFVLAGEPVANMGDGNARTAATVAIGAKQHILYVEFRKDGVSIDSSPWWAKSETRKVGG